MLSFSRHDGIARLIHVACAIVENDGKVLAAQRLTRRAFRRSWAFAIAVNLSPVTGADPETGDSSIRGGSWLDNIAAG